MKRIFFFSLLLMAWSLQMLWAGGRQPKTVPQNTGIPESVTFSEPVHQWVLTRNAAVAVFKNKAVVVSGESRREEAFPEGIVVRSAVSPNKRFFALLRVLPLTPRDKHPRKLFVSVYDAAGYLTTTIALKNPYDAPYPEIAVADDGSIALGKAAEAVVELYSPKGVRNAVFSVFPNADYDLERILYPAFFGTTGDVIIAATRHGMNSQKKMEPVVFRYKNTGSRVWQKALQADALGLLRVSPAGNAFAVGTFSFREENILQQTLVMDGASNVLTTTDLLFKTAAFSPQGKLLFLGDKHTGVFIDVQHRNVLWKKSLASGPEMIVAAAVSPNQHIAIVTARNVFREGAFVFDAPKVTILDGTGTILSEQVLEESLNAQPVVQFDAEATSVIIGLQQTLKKIKVVK